MSDKNEALEALNRVRRYVEASKVKPIKHLGECVHVLHPGTDHEAELRLSDLVKVLDLIHPEPSDPASELFKMKQDHFDCMMFDLKNWEHAGEAGDDKAEQEALASAARHASIVSAIAAMEGKQSS